MFSHSLSSSLVASVWTRTKRQQQQQQQLKNTNSNTLQQNNTNRKTTTRIHLFGKPNTGESATKESLEYELEKANKWREELGEELREAKKERAVAPRRRAAATRNAVTPQHATGQQVDRSITKLQNDHGSVFYGEAAAAACQGRRGRQCPQVFAEISPRSQH